MLRDARRPWRGAGGPALPGRPRARDVRLPGAALGQPLLLEGEAGVGKTEVAKALAAATGSRLIRLQCHEGMDLHNALYDWDYSRQLLAIRGSTGEKVYSRAFLLRRPLLEALEHDGPVVLLIDEIDRADDEFEAFLLEFLSEFQVTIPELGTVSARGKPLVMLTSNRTRELHDALKRRCLYHWIDYPDREREAAIVHARVPRRARRGRRARCAPPSRGCAARSSTSCPGWARRSPGRRRCWRSTTLTGRTFGVALKVREDIERCASGGARRCLRRLGARGVMRRLGLLAASLRAGGVRVGVGELLAAHRALAAVDPTERRDSYYALRAVLCSRQGDLEVFDAAFDETFGREFEEQEWTDLLGDIGTMVLPRTPIPPPPGPPEIPPDEEFDPTPARTARVEMLKDKDFAEFTPPSARRRSG